jgi:preprotein translocase subunit SecY
MRKLIETLINIYKIQELRERILFTLLMLMIYRFGTFVILPGINSSVLSSLFSQGQGGGILGMLDIFVGGAFSRGSILALGIMPYISASIIMQLLGAAVPSIQKLQKEGESGYRIINQYTRYLTVLITMGQSIGYLVNLQNQYPEAMLLRGFYFWAPAMILLTAGTMFLVWLGERITDKGIGNGVSLIITIGIIAELPPALINEASTNPPMIFYFEVLALILVTIGVVMVTTAVRKIPVNYARHMMTSRKMGVIQQRARQYIPLRLNSAGVMPIIFAQSIMFIPATIAQFFPDSNFWTATGTWFSNHLTLPYNLLFSLLIILFTYFYTAIIINPNDIAEQLKRSGGFIPGIKPGKKTAEYIDAVLTRITLPGSIFLALIAVMPAIITKLGVSSSFAQFFGGTSLLILIGVVLETLQQIQTYLLQRHYEGIIRTGRIQIRTIGATA